jgi:hypothetical protein
LKRTLTSRPPGSGSIFSRERSAAAAGESGMPSASTGGWGALPRNLRWKRSHGDMSGPVISSGLFWSCSRSTVFSASVLPRSSSYSVWKSCTPGSTSSFVGSTLGVTRSMRICVVAW